MALATFLSNDAERILDVWEESLRNRVPSIKAVGHTLLRDHLNAVLVSIGVKLAGESQGAIQSNSAAQLHGAQRQEFGFNLAQVSEEFALLRRAVIRTWLREEGENNSEALVQVNRFNDAFDDVVTESFRRYWENFRRAQDTFVGALAHDLRAPLQAIKMSSLATAATDQVAAFNRIARSSEVMESLIADLLDFSRSRLGRGMPIRLGSVRVKELLEDVVNEVDVEYPGHRFEICCPGSVVATWDSARIRQSLCNILVNAVNHGADGFPILITVTSSTDDVHLRITNHGSEIPIEFFHRIFEPMVQLPGEHPFEVRIEGLGLGLFIAREIVLAHGGRIEVSSSDSTVTFSIHLPLVAVAKDSSFGNAV